MNNALMDIEAVKCRLLTVRGEPSLLDRDVVALYDVGTREVNQAVRNNPDKFPAGFVVELSKGELADLQSKFLTANVSTMSRVNPKAFSI